MGTGAGMQFVSEYAIQANGLLTKWEVYTHRADVIVLQVWRPSGSLKYYLVGHTYHDAPVGYSAADAAIEVQAGDVLGWYATGVQPIVYSIGGKRVRRSYKY